MNTIRKRSMTVTYFDICRNVKEDISATGHTDWGGRVYITFFLKTEVAYLHVNKEGESYGNWMELPGFHFPILFTMKTRQIFPGEWELDSIRMKYFYNVAHLRFPSSWLVINEKPLKLFKWHCITINAYQTTTWHQKQARGTTASTVWQAMDFSSFPWINMRIAIKKSFHSYLPPLERIWRHSLIPTKDKQPKPHRHVMKATKKGPCKINT